MAEKYNGYYNYNVWNVKLFADNERDLYEKLIHAFDEYYDKKINKAQLLREMRAAGNRAENSKKSTARQHEPVEAKRPFSIQARAKFFAVQASA